MDSAEPGAAVNLILKGTNTLVSGGKCAGLRVPAALLSAVALSSADLFFAVIFPWICHFLLYVGFFALTFYRTLKRELVQDSNYDNPEQARMDIFKYIETYYNTKRIHSALDWLSTAQFEIQNS